MYGKKLTKKTRVRYRRTCYSFLLISFYSSCRCYSSYFRLLGADPDQGGGGGGRSAPYKVPQRCRQDL